jgi:formate-nitrite transporter family protein
VTAKRSKSAPNKGPRQSNRTPPRGGSTQSQESDKPEGVTERDVEDIEERSRLRTPVVYEIVRREGDLEMKRPAISLWWSGVAAGLSISFSLLAQAILYVHLPDAPWRSLVTSFGYSVGFLIVVLARQQLFTENTVTVVLPLAAEPTLDNLRRVLRMWAIVFAANMTGTLFAALFCSFTPVLAPELRLGMLELSRQMMENGWIEMFFKAISAGFVIAAMV